MIVPPLYGVPEKKPKKVKKSGIQNPIYITHKRLGRRIYVPDEKHPLSSWIGEGWRTDKMLKRVEDNRRRKWILSLI